MKPLVSDEVWRYGLEVVLESVHTHSDLRPGEREYLEFADMFIE
jgi:hypothetical protein